VVLTIHLIYPSRQFQKILIHHGVTEDS
jgi:hypothetical protein